MLDIYIRQLKREQLYRVGEIDRSDDSEHIYYLCDGQLHVKQDVFHHPGFTGLRLKAVIEELHSQYDNGGVFWGAFDGEQLVGISAIEGRFIGSQLMLNFGPLWVSKAYRGKGIGGKLFEKTKQEAKEMEATKLYVSATPTKRTVDFYMRMGCVLATKVAKELFLKEPNDIHLEFNIES